MNIPASVLEPVMGQLLEEMYFCTPSFVGQGCIDGPLLGASIAFTCKGDSGWARGSSPGDFRLVVKQSTATQMAADFLAADPGELSQSQIEAAVGELANVACGAAMSSWQPGEDFHFDVPAALPDAVCKGLFENCFSVASEGPELAIEVVSRPSG